MQCVASAVKTSPSSQNQNISSRDTVILGGANRVVERGLKMEQACDVIISYHMMYSDFFRITQKSNIDPKANNIDFNIKVLLVLLQSVYFKALNAHKMTRND